MSEYEETLKYIFENAKNVEEFMVNGICNNRQISELTCYVCSGAYMYYKHMSISV